MYLTTARSLLSAPYGQSESPLGYRRRLYGPTRGHGGWNTLLCRLAHGISVAREKADSVPAEGLKCRSVRDQISSTAFWRTATFGQTFHDRAAGRRIANGGNLRRTGWRAAVPPNRRIPSAVQRTATRRNLRSRRTWSGHGSGRSHSPFISPCIAPPPQPPFCVCHWNSVYYTRGRHPLLPPSCDTIRGVVPHPTDNFLPRD